MSTAPAVKGAISTILAADANLNAVDKRWSPPTESEDYGQEPEAVFFGDVEVVDDNWSQLGRSDGQGRRRESYWLALSVLVAQMGDDPQTTEERAWTVWGYVVSAIRTDLFAASSEIRDAGAYQFDQITVRQTTGVWAPQMWAARIDGRILFNAQS